PSGQRTNFGPPPNLKVHPTAADGRMMHRAPDDAPRPRPTIRLGVVVLGLLALVGSFTARTTGDAAATPADEADFVAALNQVRAQAGLPAFTINTELSNLARGHAQVMADAGEIFHASPISAGYTGQWSKIGENVGVGADVAVLVDAFVASPGHYANIVDPAFTEIGVGVVWRESALYTTHRFLQVPGAAPAPTTTAPPSPTTTAAPAPTTTAPATTVPTTTAPADEPAPVEAEPLGPPSIDAARVEALLDLLDRVGT
ncbi:MAG: CAP domain-containing protein, partial [Actinomycetota bacterium]